MIRMKNRYNTKNPAVTCILEGNNIFSRSVGIEAQKYLLVVPRFKNVS